MNCAVSATRCWRLSRLASGAADVVAFARGEAAEPLAWMRETWLIGTPDEIEAQIRRFAELGVTHFMLWFVDAPDDSGMRLFAERILGRLGA